MTGISRAARRERRAARWGKHGVRCIRFIPALHPLYTLSCFVSPEGSELMRFTSRESSQFGVRAQ